MDFIPETPYFRVSSDTLQMVRKEINMEKPGEMKEAVRILDEWVKQQTHFVKKQFPLHYLEMSIVMSKGSVERAKRVISNICAARTLRPQYFEPRDPKEYYEIFKDHFSVIATPRLTSEFYRIFVIKVTGKFENDIIIAVYKFAYICLEYVKAHDYNSGIVLIFDATDADIQHFITHINLFELRNCFLTFLDSYGMRLKKCHVITPSKVIQGVISFFKPFLSKKIYERVIVNEKVEDLLDYYTKDALPKDYGGNDKTIQELQEIIAYKMCTEEELDLLRNIFEIKIDKSTCTSSQLSEMDGTNGTFRSLNID